MSDQLSEFGAIAKGFARNPLGIIALFIVLVYGFACVVTAAAWSFTPGERVPLIYFLVFFPILVLGVFTWLVSRHSGNLFAPADFKDESNYLRMQKMQLAAVASLAAAGSKNPKNPIEPDLEQTVTIVQKATLHGASRSAQKQRLLWVDDHPEYNVYERRAFEAMGITVTLSLNTADALDQLARQKFGAVISDMDRKEGPVEGYVLLEAMHSSNYRTPIFFYSPTTSPDQKQETLQLGGQGRTDNANELFSMVIDAVTNGKPKAALAAPV